MRIAGIHLEGPYISELDGYRGAHPLGAVRDPDWGEFQALQDTAEGRIAVVTLAPERPGAIALIEKLAQCGVVVALGRDGGRRRDPARGGRGGGAVEHAPGQRHRRDAGRGTRNPIWHQAALDYLSASFIADGHHLDRAVLRVLVRAKGAGRVILVSDASPLAGLPVGTYGDWAVDPSGKIVVAGTPYLAGSNQGLETGLNVLMDATDLSLEEAIATVTRNPARLLDRPAPALEPGQPANLVVFRRPRPGPPGWDSHLFPRTCVDGGWTDAGLAAPVRTPRETARSQRRGRSTPGTRFPGRDRQRRLPLWPRR